MYACGRYVTSPFLQIWHIGRKMQIVSAEHNTELHNYKA